MILIDTSALIDAITGPRRSASRLREFILDGERIRLTTLVLFEWRRGPRSTQEIADQESLFSSEDAIPMGTPEALVAADLYRKVKRARGREMDLAIAACAITHDSRLWTLNPQDLKDIPNLKLV
jgi:predicted nucleic acid-binding protein